MNIYTDMPKHLGELRFAERMGALLDERAHVWFGVNYLPSVNEIDVLLWHEEIGIFTIEVKAISLEMFESFGLTQCKIERRELGPSPHAQAQRAELSLRQYLNARKIKTFFNTPTAAFPHIVRAEWNARWGPDSPLAGEWAETVIFQDDLQGSQGALRRRLTHIFEKPPSGCGSKKQFVHNPTTFESFKRTVSPLQEKPQPIPSDLDRLRELEKSVYRETKNRFPAFGAAKAVYVGHPGTGKTFRLLQIGYEHANAGAKVLFICFNKVLAADIRRILISREFESQQLRLGEEPEDSFVLDVVDVWEVLKQRLDERGLGGEFDSESKPNSNVNSFDVRGRNTVELLETVRDEIAIYDTVLIDEAQDFKEWQLKLARLHLKQAGTLLVAYGRGQELYPVDPSVEPLLEEFPKQALRRNFRNTKESFRAAYVAHQSQLDRERIKSSARRFAKEFVGQEQGLDFERPEGRYPMIDRIDMKSLSGEDPSSVFFAEEEQGRLAAGYRQIIQEQIRYLDERHRPIDLLLLVPSEKCVEARAARSALEELGQEFADLTDESLRRTIVPATSVRLCTFHSARGIEGHRVVVLGLSHLPQLCERIRLDKPENLLYVILSRAVFETTIVVRSDESNDDIVIFMEEVIDHLINRGAST
jgi:hypothetical protein